MSLLAIRLFPSPPDPRRLHPGRWRLVILGRRPGRQLQVLLLETAILRLQRFDPLLQYVVALVGDEPLFTIMIAVRAEKLVFAPKELCFLLPLLVEFAFPAIPGSIKLLPIRKSRAG
jgi:hypothetical protein